MQYIQDPNHHKMTLYGAGKSCELFGSARDELGIVPYALPTFKHHGISDEMIKDIYHRLQGAWGNQDLQELQCGGELNEMMAYIASTYPTLFKIFSTYKDDQFILYCLHYVYGKAGMLKAFKNLNDGLCDSNSKVGQAITKAARYCQNNLKCTIFNVLADNDVAESLQAVILELQKRGEPEEALARELQNRAKFKGIGMGSGACLDVLNNALSVPKEYWQQLMWVYYHFAVSVNNVARHFHCDIPRIATPRELSDMRGKLSDYGKHCLEENPACGEPRYRARCFKPATEMEGMDGCTWIVQKDQTWLRREGKDQDRIEDRIKNKEENQYKHPDGSHDWWRQANQIVDRASEENPLTIPLEPTLTRRSVTVPEQQHQLPSGGLPFRRRSALMSGSADLEAPHRGG